jgi:hypothetical protein
MPVAAITPASTTGIEGRYVPFPLLDELSPSPRLLCRNWPIPWGGLRPASSFRDCPVYYMSPARRAPKSAKSRILNSLFTIPESPLSHPPGHLASSRANHPESTPAGTCPRHPGRDLDDRAASPGAGSLPEDPAGNSVDRLDDNWTDCLDDRPGKYRGNTGADSLPGRRANSPADSPPGRLDDCPAGFLFCASCRVFGVTAVEQSLSIGCRDLPRRTHRARQPVSSRSVARARIRKSARGAEGDGATSGVRGPLSPWRRKGRVSGPPASGDGPPRHCLPGTRRGRDGTPPARTSAGS